MNLLYNFKIASNELCPCGSQKSYKECCRNKQNRLFHNDNEIKAVISKNSRKSRIKICLAKGCNQKGKSISKAHALQENRILSKIAKNNIVMMQNQKEDPLLIETKRNHPEAFYLLKNMKIKDATISTCFCSIHDNKIFEKIEKTQYDLQTLDSEQLFLFAYRTFIFEYYKEYTQKLFHSYMFKDVPQLMRNPYTINIYRGCTQKLDDLEYYKQNFENILENKAYEQVETIIKEIPFEIPFANYMTVAANFDLFGRKVKPISKGKIMKRIFITTFPVENKSYILLSVLKNDYDVYEAYVKSFKEASMDLITFYLNSFIPLYSDNLILSPLLWETWDEYTQMGIQYAVAEKPSRANVLLKGIQFYLKNIHKSPHLLQTVSSKQIKFDFFKDMNSLKENN